MAVARAVGMTFRNCREDGGNLLRREVPGPEAEQDKSEAKSFPFHRPSVFLMNDDEFSVSLAAVGCGYEEIIQPGSEELLITCYLIPWFHVLAVGMLKRADKLAAVGVHADGAEWREIIETYAGIGVICALKAGSDEVGVRDHVYRAEGWRCGRAQTVRFVQND